MQGQQFQTAAEANTKTKIRDAALGSATRGNARRSAATQREPALGPARRRIARQGKAL